ncbi:bacteriophage, scaffolding family protein, partial [Vibrio cholerae HC-17A1]
LSWMIFYLMRHSVNMTMTHIRLTLLFRLSC